jgi:PAS domain S-box-containing protein
VANSGPKAIAFVKERASGIDLILMDINLGRGMDGTEAAREILREFDIPILFLSSYTDRGTLEKTQNVSSYGFVIKSSGTPVLIASIRMAINLHRLLAEMRKPEPGSMWDDNFESLLRPAAATVADEAEQRRVVEALRESEERHRLISSLTTDYFFRLSVGEDGRVVLDQISSNFPEFTGRTIGDAATPELWKTFIHPDDIDQLNGELRKLLIEGGSAELECRSIVRDGRQRWVSVVGRALRTPGGGRTTAIFGAVKDITVRKTAEEDLKDALAQKDVLMREMRHRIKNSLAVVSGLLSLETENMTHPGCREILRNTRARILSISSIYDILNKSTDPSRIDLKALVTHLGEALMRSHSGTGRRFAPVFSLEDVCLDAQRAFPLAFILNELITNALKHAYPADSVGEIRIDLRKNEGKILLRVEDDGTSLPAGVDPKTAETTGLSLIRILAEQVDAVCVFTSSGGGTKVSVELPE